jgi:hypothetical protein
MKLFQALDGMSVLAYIKDLITNSIRKYVNDGYIRYYRCTI